MLNFHTTNESQQGFAYLSLLIFIAILGLTTSASVQVTSLMNRRSAEDALLTIGSEYANALNSYSQNSPPGADDEPLSLQELLRDTRNPPAVMRHLRQIYPDPITGSPSWGLVTDPDTKRIQGVFSQSEAKPVKVGNFSQAYQSFGNKLQLREWVFTAEIGRSIEAGEDLYKSSKNIKTKSKYIDPSSLYEPPKSVPVEQAPPRRDGLMSPSELQQ
jgi:type II secretory pathway pseudopilin PulG